MAEPERTYLLVDGENIDGALGGILGHKPDPGQRPGGSSSSSSPSGAGSGRCGPCSSSTRRVGLHAPFVQALIAMDYRPIPLAGRADEKVVDIGIQRTLDALRDRPGNVLLASHDGDFVPHMTALVGDGRRIGVVAFSELVSQALREVPSLEIFDLESDADVFDVDLPHVRIIALDDFDPTRFL